MPPASLDPIGPTQASTDMTRRTNSPPKHPMSNDQSRRVTLHLFQGTKSAPEAQRAGEDYWRLIGHSGAVVETDDAPVGRLPSGPRVLVQFDVDPADLGLHCHNPVARALWIKGTDLVDESEA
jgi:hypothetical protein